MAIELRAPDGFGTHPPGGVIVLSNGSTLCPQGGWYNVPDDLQYAVEILLRQGFRTREQIEEEAARRRERDALSPLQRELLDHPLQVDEILELAAKERIFLRNTNDELELCGPAPSERLDAHIRHRKAALISHLSWRPYE